MRPRPWLTSLLALAAGALACRSAPAPEPTQRDLAAPRFTRTWTTAFQREAVLVADEIRIEGPADLLDHVVLQQDPETADYSTRTTTEGLLQELVAKPQMGTAVRAQLDAWSMAAVRRVTVLQRPGDLAVTVRAAGNAVWVAADGSGERRENELVFQGAHAR